MTVIDFRFALRSFRKQPGFTATVVATLALGIGATTTVFSVVHGVLLKPLPYADADRLVNVYRLPLTVLARDSAQSIVSCRLLDSPKRRVRVGDIGAGLRRHWRVFDEYADVQDWRRARDAADRHGDIGRVQGARGAAAPRRGADG